MAELTKGTLFVRERGLLYTFMFNPAELEITKAINYPNETPAGGSNPIYNFSSGGERLITFTLYLDGDRGRSDQRPRGADSIQQISNDTFSRTPVTNVDTGQGIPLSILDEANLLQSLLYPSQYGKSIREVYPYICIFSFGETFKALPVIVKKADPKFNFFTDKLAPTKGTVAMQLAVIKSSYETAAEFAATAQESAEAAAPARDAIQAGISAIGAVGAAASSVLGTAGGLYSAANRNYLSTFRRLAMSVKKDSRNNLTDTVQLISGVTGLPIKPAYLDLRDRAPRDVATDQEITVLDHVASFANIGTLTMHDPRFWWAVADVSDVVDPFDLAVGDRLLVPAHDRLLFDIMEGKD